MLRALSKLAWLHMHSHPRAQRSYTNLRTMMASLRQLLLGQPNYHRNITKMAYFYVFFLYQFSGKLSNYICVQSLVSLFSCLSTCNSSNTNSPLSLNERETLPLPDRLLLIVFNLLSKLDLANCRVGLSMLSIHPAAARQVTS